MEPHTLLSLLRASLQPFKVGRSISSSLSLIPLTLSLDYLFSNIILKQLTRETSVAAAPTNAAINRWKVIWNCRKMRVRELFVITENKSMIHYK